MSNTLRLLLALVGLGAACTDAAGTATDNGEPVFAITVDAPADPLLVGETVQLDAVLEDRNGNELSGREVQWESSSPAVAMVDGAGLVTGLAEGSATISAAAEGRTGSASVTVVDPPRTPFGGIAYVRGDELRLVEVDGSGDRRVWKAPRVDASNPDLRYEVTAPAWRPDATEIAFVSDHQMAISFFQKDLYAIRPDGAGMRKLTYGPSHERLTSYRKGTVTVTVSNPAFNGGPFFVYLVGAPEPQRINLPVGGSTRLTFTNVADLGEGVFQPVVVIDGIQRWWDAAAAADVQPDRTTDAGRLALTAYPMERFGVHWPLWRADGSKVGFVMVAVVAGNPACLLQQLPANPPPASSGDPLLDSQGFGPVCAADWAPNPALAGELLVVDETSEYSETGRTHVFRVREGSRTRGTPVATFDRYVRVLDIRWLPDGSGFLVARQDDLVDEDVNLYEFTFATRSLRKITDFTGEFVRSFSLSPDGSAIVFERVTGGSIHDLATLPSDLWVVSRDGSGARLLARDGKNPAWSPKR